jgi:hypothetical protein
LQTSEDRNAAATRFQRLDFHRTRHSPIQEENVGKKSAARFGEPQPITHRNPRKAHYIGGSDEPERAGRHAE